MAGKGGGAWKVAYADFVTAMMAFFMVMWLTSQKPEVKQAVAGYFRDPYAIFHGNESGFATAPTPTDDPQRGHDAEAQKRRLPNTGDEADYKFTILFAEGQSEVDAAGREMIRTFAPTMVGKLNRIEVRAHCERKPLPADSPFKDRWELCYARGRAVQHELADLGVDEGRMRVSLAEANEPLATNLTEDELKLNSRVDVILLSDLVETPWQTTTGDGHGGRNDALGGGHDEAEEAPADHGDSHETSAGHGESAEAHETPAGEHEVAPPAEDAGSEMHGASDKTDSPAESHDAHEEPAASADSQASPEASHDEHAAH